MGGAVRFVIAPHGRGCFEEQRIMADTTLSPTHSFKRTAIFALGLGAIAALALAVPAAAQQTVTEYAIPTANAQPRTIAAGPDGNLWFTEQNTNRIGLIDTAGNVTEILLHANSGPDGIVAGPDGALWFTELTAGKIGRITTAGVVTEFPVAGSAPVGITAGPDGALWFTDRGNNKIGRITTGRSRRIRHSHRQQ
jgi:virginiamycin B lyase